MSLKSLSLVLSKRWKQLITTGRVVETALLKVAAFSLLGFYDIKPIDSALRPILGVPVIVLTGLDDNLSILRPFST